MTFFGPPCPREELMSEEPDRPAKLGRDQLIDAYRRMQAIREVDERMRREVEAGKVPGFLHLYCGQEAIAVGACIHLETTDYIASNHRPHGHFIAKGCDLGKLLLEIYCKRDGLCRGKGGTMHQIGRVHV